MNYPNHVSAAKNILFTKKEILDILHRWDSEEYLLFAEKSLTELFGNSNQIVSSKKEIEYTKVNMLNVLYGTNLRKRETIALASYLADNCKSLSEMIRGGSPEAVSLITTALKKHTDSGRYCYSFATKYCSFAAPEGVRDEYPIFDSTVSAVYRSRRDVWDPNRESGIRDIDLASWRGEEAEANQQYCKYKRAVNCMRTALKKEQELTTKELDQYLWLAMREITKEQK